MSDLASVIECGPCGGDECRVIKGLVEMTLESRGLRPLVVSLAGETAHRDDRRVILSSDSTQLAKEFEAVHPRHAQVAQYKIRPARGHYVQRFESVGNCCRGRDEPAGGFREYDDAAVDRVRSVKQAQAHGLTLREIRDLVSHQSDAWRTRCRHVRDLKTAASKPTPLFSDSEIGEFRSRWSSVQTGFVDELRRSVEDVDKLVASVMQRLAERFANERSGLETQWDQGNNVSTEELQVALQRCRSFFDRLLTLEGQPAPTERWTADVVHPLDCAATIHCACMAG